jgi:hypothetical protein
MTDATETTIIQLLRDQGTHRDGQHKEIVGKVEALAQSVLEHEHEDRHVHDALGGRLATLEQGAEETGRFQVAARKRQLKRAEQTLAQWRARGWKALGTVALMVLVGLATHFLSTF